MLSATGVHRNEGFPYAIDNGAWTAFKKNQPFNSEAFERLLETHGQKADFITVPDIVCGGNESLEFSKKWLQRLIGCYKLLLIPVQDGMDPEQVRPLLGKHVGIFIGGSDKFKESTMSQWKEMAKDQGCLIHCGRVNSKRRLKLCQLHGIDSFDGSGPSRFVIHGRVMDAQYRQGVLY